MDEAAFMQDMMQLDDAAGRVWRKPSYSTGGYNQQCPIHCALREIAAEVAAELPEAPLPEAADVVAGGVRSLRKLKNMEGGVSCPREPTRRQVDEARDALRPSFPTSSDRRSAFNTSTSNFDELIDEALLCEHMLEEAMLEDDLDLEQMLDMTGQMMIATRPPPMMTVRTPPTPKAATTRPSSCTGLESRPGHTEGAPMNAESESPTMQHSGADFKVPASDVAHASTPPGDVCDEVACPLAERAEDQDDGAKPIKLMMPSATRVFAPAAAKPAFLRLRSRLTASTSSAVTSSSVDDMPDMSGGQQQ
eukprot:TRINITY_DN41932_c0_g1_i1.p1 TRINITY_DN41932_c0_g1~~TRINITY_DN41932_c0_g1_i1.p1  ORF type:complete len:306 (-),score=55.16 TRINITY_DN41932_c0_g1_i1:97-1014(-)